jgi:tetratricopeptide (TPR) repeat protein
MRLTNFIQFVLVAGVILAVSFVLHLPLNYPLFLTFIVLLLIGSLIGYGFQAVLARVPQVRKSINSLGITEKLNIYLLFTLLISFLLVVVALITNLPSSSSPVRLFLIISLILFAVLLFFPTFISILGLLLVVTGKLRTAISFFSLLIRIDSKDGTAYSNRAGIWFRCGEYGRAIADYTKAIELAQVSQSHRILLSTIRYDLGDFYAQRANSHFANEDYVSAISDCNVGLAVEGNSSFTKALLLLNRGRANFEQGDYRRSLVDFDSLPTDIAAKDQSTIPTVHISAHRALIYYLLGERAQALLLWQKVLEASPNFADGSWLIQICKWSMANVAAANEMTASITNTAKSTKSQESMQ